MGYIYCITNKINGKKYIGQSRRDNGVRIKEHFQIAHNSRTNLHLYNSIRKYGEDNFTIEMLKENIPECELDRWEIYYIKKYNTLVDGYNNTKGGGGVRGYHHSDDVRKKISEHHNPNIYTAERNKKISFALKGKSKSAEHRRKLSECRKGKYTKEANGFYGKHHTAKSNYINSIKHRKYIYKQIELNSNQVINTFFSIHDVCQYILDNNLSQAKSASIAYRIYQTIYGNQQQAYGFGWVGEKCNDYPEME